MGYKNMKAELKRAGATYEDAGKLLDMSMDRIIIHLRIVAGEGQPS